MELEDQKLQFYYPRQILEEFEEKAKNHFENGSLKELMGCVIGYRDGNNLIGTELLFPQQTCSHTNVTDLGKEHLGKTYKLQI